MTDDEVRMLSRLNARMWARINELDAATSREGRSDYYAGHVDGAKTAAIAVRAWIEMECPDFDDRVRRLTPSN